MNTPVWKSGKSEGLTRGPSAHALIILVVLGICLGPLSAIEVEASGCQKRVIDFKITESDIAEIERGEAEGHQPWRSDAHTVAEVGLGMVEPKLDPRTADQIPFKRTIISNTHEIFTFKLTKRHHVDQITLRRLHWRNPRTGKTQLTVWWATKAMISACPLPAHK